MPTVFVADRDPASRKGLAHALRQYGLTVEEFENGPALYAQALTDDPDLILLETDLEEMDGFQVFARLQRRRPEKPFPVLFVTDFDHPRVARVCRQRGAMGYIAKSKPLEQIVDAVLDVLGQPDPLAGRTLSAALAWLQSHGKTGRIDVDADGRIGYVVLHKGRVLEAAWGPWQGEDVVVRLSDSLPDSKYAFTEGADDFDLPPVAVDAPPPEPLGAGPARSNGSAALKEPTPETPSASRPVFQHPSGPAVQRPRIPFAGSSGLGERAPSGGAVEALRELRARGVGSGRRRRALATAAILLLFVGVSVGLIALSSGSLPNPLAGMLALGTAVEGDQQGTGSGAGSGDLAGSGPGAGAAREVEPGAAAPVAPGEDTSRTFDVAPASAAVQDRGFRPGGGATENTQPPEPAAAEPAADELRARERERTLARGRADADRSPQDAGAPEAGTERRRPAEAERDTEEPPSIAAPEERTPAPAPPSAPVGDAAPREDAARVTEAAPPPAPPPAAVLPEREIVPAPVPSDRTGQGRAAAPAAPAPTRTPRAEGAGQSLLKKPVLLQRGEGLYYPPELRAQSVGGSVVLNIRVGENGRAQQVEIARSSGYEAFDQAAVAAVGTFLWEPAQDASGPAEAWITQAVTFRP
jgi:protein TonB